MPRPAARLLTALLLTLAIPATALAAGDLVVSGSLVSTVATGTPPLAVNSTTKVDDLNVDLLDGLHGSAFALSLGNVVRVGTSGGDFTSIQAALDSITTASAANPFLVLVGPGIYDEQVVMKENVDIQGAGEGVTRIRQSGGATGLATVAGADDAELRFLTVENTGASGFVYGVYNDGTSPRLVHVTVEVASGTDPVYGIRNEAGSSTELLHVTVIAEGEGSTYGVQNQGDDTRMEHVRVEVAGGGLSGKWGVHNAAAGIVLDDVEIVVTSASTSPVLHGLLNFGVVDATIRGVRVVASGGQSTFGVSNDQVTSLTLRDLEVEVSAGDLSNRGVYNEESTVVLESCSITAREGNVVGIEYQASSGALVDCTVEVSTGEAIRGSGSTDDFTIDVQHSRVLSSLSAITGPANFTFRIGASQIDGTLGSLPAFTCIHSYDGSFAPLAC